MISFIIPTLNEEKILEQTIRGLQLLQNQEFEIIISDGGSKDTTLAIAEKLGAKTIIYTGTTRQTIANGRNLGAGEATGDVLIFLDADVTIPDINIFIPQVLKKLNQKPNILAMTVALKTLPTIATLADKIFSDIMNYIYFINNNIFHFGGAGGEFQVIRSEAFKKVGGFNDTLVAGEDNELFYRLARIGTTYMDLSLTVYHPARRAHKIGWGKLLFLYFKNWITGVFLKKSSSTEWDEIR
jgi:glycosyltransferase involved in cell wall biosynthesis